MKEDKQKRLTQEELERWWPFTRLDPKRFPKAPSKDPVQQPDCEEALL